MPCNCGQKVDRSQRKVQCAKCKKLFHLECVGLLPADVEFLLTSLKPFFCNSCSAERRISLRSPPSPVTGFEETQAKHIESDNQQATSSEQQLTLSSISEEISALRKENAHILSLVISLHDDKKSIMQKSDALHEEIRTLHSKLNAKDSEISALIAEVKSLQCIVASRAYKTVCTRCVSKDNNGDLTSSIHSLSISAPSSSSYCAVLDKNSNVRSSGASTSATQLLAASYSAALTHTPTPKANVKTSTSTLTSSGANAAPVNIANAATHKVASLGSVSNLLSDSSSAQNTAAADPNIADNAMSHISHTSEWKIVSRKNRSKLKEPLVIGSNTNNELSVVENMKWLHLSSFSSNVTASDIMAYVSKHAKIDSKFFVCYALIKKEAQISTIKKINFKLGVSECFVDKVLNSDIWPTNVKIRPFRFFPRDGTQHQET